MLVNRFRLILICLCTSVFVNAQNYSEAQCKFQDQVEQYKVQEDYEGALLLCDARLAQIDATPPSVDFLNTVKVKAKLILYHMGNAKKVKALLRPLKNIRVDRQEEYISNWAECMYLLGRAYDKASDIDSAIYFFSMALNAQLDLAFPDHEGLAANYSYMGYVYCYVKKDFPMAEHFYLQEQKSLNRFEASENAWAIHYLNLASTYSQRDYEKALNCYTKALSHTSSSEEFRSTRRKCYNNLANIRYRQKKYREAIKYYREALNLLNEGDETYVLDNIGLAYKNLNQHDSAEYYISRARESNIRTYGRESAKAAESDFLLSYVTNDPVKARRLRKVAIDQKYKFFNHRSPEMSRVFGMVGNWFEERGQLDSALHYYQMALYQATDSVNMLRAPKMNYDFFYELNLHLPRKARVLFKLGLDGNSTSYLKAAIRHYKRLSNLYQDFLMYRHSEQERLEFVKTIKDRYNEAVEVSYILHQKTGGHLDDLWYFMEKSKAAVLLLQAREASDELYSYKDKELVKQKRELSGRRKYYEELARNSSSASDSLRLLLFEISQKMDSMNTLLGVNDKTLDSVYNESVRGLSEIKDQLFKGADQCVVQFFTTDTDVYSLKVSNQEVIVNKVEGADFKDLMEHVQKVQQSLFTGLDFANRQKGYEEFTESAGSLYKLLLLPLQVSAYKNIIIIPDGFLTEIPFEVLLTKKVSRGEDVNYRDLPYLLKEARVSYGYSASWISAHKGVLGKPRTMDLGLLAFAYSDSSLSVSNDQKQQAELPGSVTEVAALKAVWDGSFKSYIGSNASEANFKQAQPGYDVLHLAIHNTIDSKNSLKSGLIFRDGRNRKEDDVLHIYEIYQLTPGARMVVLSACESGIGEYSEGEGPLSVGRAFAQMGASFVVSSLWKTSDVFSNQQMKLFYSGIRDGSGPAEALHQSKLDLIKESDELNAHPSHWASYIMMGNPNTLLQDKSSAKSNASLWIGGLCVIFLVFFGGRYWLSRKYI